MNAPDGSDLENWLDERGWTLECESPLEISLSDDMGGSRASGAAAEMVIDALVDQLESSEGQQ